MNKFIAIFGAIFTAGIYIFGFLKGKKSESIKENENVVKSVQKFNEIKQNTIRYSDSKLDDAVQKFNTARDKVNK